MDDVAALRRTIRRCTALLIAAVGRGFYVLAGFGALGDGFGTPSNGEAGTDR